MSTNEPDPIQPDPSSDQTPGEPPTHERALTWREIRRKRRADRAAKRGDDSTRLRDWAWTPFDYAFALVELAIYAVLGLAD